MAKRIVASLGVALVLGVTACGNSGGDSGMRDALVSAFKESANASGASITVDDELAGCIVDSVLDDAAIREKLQTAFDDGAAGQKLLDAVGDSASQSDGTALMMGCFSSEQLVDMMAGQLVEGRLPTDEEKQCLVDEFDKIDKDELTEGIVSIGSEQAESTGGRKLAAATVTCLGFDPAS